MAASDEKIRVLILGGKKTGFPWLLFFVCFFVCNMTGCSMQVQLIDSNLLLSCLVY